MFYMCHEGKFVGRETWSYVLMFSHSYSITSNRVPTAALKPGKPWILLNIVQVREKAWNFILKQGKPWICHEILQNLEFYVFTISYDPKLFLGNLTE